MQAAGSGWGMRAAADGHMTELAAMTPEGGGLIIGDKLQRRPSWQRVVWQRAV